MLETKRKLFGSWTVRTKGLPTTKPFPKHQFPRPLGVQSVLTLLAVLIILSASLLTGPAQLANAGTVNADINIEFDRLLASAGLDKSTIAIVARDLENSETLIFYNGSDQLIPASNMKLITTGAALLALGPDFSFQTKTLRTSDGRIVIVGSGDPGLGDPVLLRQMGLSINDLVDVWADDFIKAGITDIPELIIDDRVFDRTFHHPQWMAEDLIHAYGAQVAGFNLFANTLHFYFKPGRTEGSAPSYQVEPDVEFAIVVENRAKTLPKSSQQKSNALWLDRRTGTNEFIISGKIRLPGETDITVHNPPALFAGFIADRMKLKGIQIRKVRLADPNEILEGEVVGRIIQTRLVTVLERANTDSVNLYAEALLKRIGYEVTGQPGSFANGAAVVRSIIAKALGPSLATQIIISDGSGLSRDNRVTAELLVEWLAYLHQQEDAIANMFKDSLADAGESGTLRKRFKKIKVVGEVDAKSGYMSGISCLTGYVTSEGGRTAAFAVLVNDIPARIPIAKAKALQENVTRIIGDYLKQQDAINPIANVPTTNGG